MTDIQKHSFILQPGLWLGEGKVTFSVSPEVVKFYTKWTVKPLKEGSEIQGNQIVEIQGIEEHVINQFTFSNIGESTFKVLLENDSLEAVCGQGIIDNNKIAWEFRGNESFEGFEVYEFEGNNSYIMHAEYSSPDQFRTIISGRIWKKMD